MRLRLRHFLPSSRANGPGARAVVWVQGCSLDCPACFNPETHSFSGGQWIEVDALFAQIHALARSIEGVTLSGGEPLQQRTAVAQLLRRIRRETRLSVILFSGYNWFEIQRRDLRLASLDPSRRLDLLNHVDVLVAGRYDATQHLARGLRGSANKTVHFLTDRYTADDLDAVPPAEILIDSRGSMVLSGIQPVEF